ncbi:MAG: metallopeptidase TldD-related protein [Chitinivibrionales bacterium]|nr:metallopeptidase TldD-related protein [Chitinivibrionales bacterium]
MNCRAIIIFIAGVVVALPAKTRESSGDSNIVTAMQQELDRSTQSLQIAKMHRPYFIGYRLTVRDAFFCGASFGSITNANANRLCEIEIDLRVGSPQSDNSNFFNGNRIVNGTFKGGQGLLNGDSFILRRALWLATDAAYKQALKDYAQKESVAKNRSRLEELDDFAPAPACTVMADGALPTIDNLQTESLARQTSARFKRYAKLSSSSVYFSIQDLKTYYVNSEGGRFVRCEPGACFGVSAKTQLDDGVPLEDTRQVFGSTLATLGSPQQLIALADSVGALLTALCSAPLAQRYIGPALFTGQAARELFSRTMVPQFCVPRHPLCANADANATFDIKPFLDRLGGRVLPEYMDVSDDPTALFYQNTSLAGSFAVDDEGVPARRKMLVAKGILTGLLTTRAPVSGIAASSGNKRGALPLPGNIIVTAEHGLGNADLIKKLLELVRKRNLQYGIIVRRIGDPNSAQFTVNRGSMSARGLDGSMVIKNCTEVYKIYPGGRQELIRNAELTGISLEAFKYLSAASREVSVGSFSLYAGDVFPYSGNESHPVSLVVPSLLFEDVVIKKISDEVPKAPFWPHPVYTKTVLP